MLSIQHKKRKIMRKKKRKELKEGGGKKRGREIGTVWVGVEAWVGEKGPGPGSAGNPKSKHQWVLVSLQRPDHAQSPHSFLLCSSRICCSALLDPFAVHCQVCFVTLTSLLSLSRHYHLTACVASVSSTAHLLTIA